MHGQNMTFLADGHEYAESKMCRTMRNTMAHDTSGQMAGDGELSRRAQGALEMRHTRRSHGSARWPAFIEHYCRLGAAPMADARQVRLGEILHDMHDRHEFPAMRRLADIYRRNLSHMPATSH